MTFFQTRGMIIKMKKLLSLSVFFPAYNEEENLPALIEQTMVHLPQFAENFEIIIVNDGSGDNTKTVAEDLAAKYHQVKVVSHHTNLGYGAALKTGFATAKYDWVFFTDADLQFDLAELGQFLAFTDEYKAIIGYRTARAEGFGRARNAYLFKLFVNLLFRVHVRDIDCAFKLFRTELIPPLKLQSNGAFISSELLYKLKKNHIKIKELPVTHYPRLRGNPTGANFKVVIKAGLDAIQLYSSIKLRRLKNHQW